MLTLKTAGAQGEVNINVRKNPVTKIPPGCMKIEAVNGFLIVGHSEKGHHHGFHDNGDVELLEQKRGVPTGMKIIWAIVNNPTALVQSASEPHDGIWHDPGIYEFRLSREYKPLLKQARAVID